MRPTLRPNCALHTPQALGARGMIARARPNLAAMQHFWRTQIGDLGMHGKSVPRLAQGHSFHEGGCGIFGESSGAWGRIRTTDTRIFNPLLYQLSYPGL